MFDGFHGLFNNGSVDHFTGRGSNILDGLGSNYGCGNGVSVSVMGISGSGIRMTGISQRKAITRSNNSCVGGGKDNSKNNLKKDKNN